MHSQTTGLSLDLTINTVPHSISPWKHYDNMIIGMHIQYAHTVETHLCDQSIIITEAIDIKDELCYAYR